MNRVRRSRLHSNTRIIIDFPFRCVCVDTLWKGRNVLSAVAAGCFFFFILLRAVCVS